jgi:hypothetical protein
MLQLPVKKLWTDQVVRIEDTRNACRILEVKPEDQKEERRIIKKICFTNMQDVTIK